MNETHFKPNWVNIIFLGLINLVGLTAAIWWLGRLVWRLGQGGSWRWGAILTPVPLLVVVLGGASGLAVTMGYHRYWSHRSFRCRGWVRWVLALCGALAFEGGLLQWIQRHRLHHAMSDVPGFDPHTPYEFTGLEAARRGGVRAAGLKGFLWSHVLCYCFDRVDPPRLSIDMDRRVAAEFASDRVVRWHQRFWLIPAVSLGYLAPFAIGGWRGLLYAGFARTALVLNITWSVNSVCHTMGRSRLRDLLGQEFMADNSADVWWLALPGFGEPWHGLHHAFATWAWVTKWYQPDLTKYAIVIAERLGWVWDVLRPLWDFQFHGWQLRPPTLPTQRRGRPPAAGPASRPPSPVSPVGGIS